jgi:hypothetical protein
MHHGTGSREVASVRTYPDGAVMEEESERGRAGDRRLGHGLLDGAPDNGLQFGADARVVARPQLRGGQRRQEHNDDGEEG